ncbi:tumor necrosis factor ligand superfamily member 10-like isoform X2 [Stigmatopora argus]
MNFPKADKGRRRASPGPPPPDRLASPHPQLPGLPRASSPFRLSLSLSLRHTDRSLLVRRRSRRAESLRVSEAAYRGGARAPSVAMTAGWAAKLGLALLAAVLLQSLLVVLTLLRFATSLDALKETFSRSSVSCLKGWDLESQTSTEGAGTGAPATRGHPCWQVTQQLQQLVHKSLTQRYQKYISSAVKERMFGVPPSPEDDGAPRPKVGAHVTGSFVPKTDAATAATLVRRVHGQKIWWWEGEKGLAFLQDIQLVDGELVVPRPGLYYVYAQTYFRHVASEDEDAEDQDRGRPLLQYVYKKLSSYPVPILLMKTSRTSCWSRHSQFSLHSAHQGGLFALGPGDRLFVTVTDASAVDADEKSSFFGAFLVS